VGGDFILVGARRARSIKTSCTDVESI
jgi:hypothetical protein